MILYIVLSIIVSIFGLMMGFFPTVETLPFGIDYALTFFVNTIKAILNIMPIFEVVWNLILFAIGVKFLLFSWVWIRWFIERIR